MLARILTAAAMLIALKLIPVTGVLQLALYLVAYLVIGWRHSEKAWRGILNRQVFDEKLSDGRGHRRRVRAGDRLRSGD